jgi:phosphoribosylanthranilate isomerase
LHGEEGEGETEEIAGLVKNDGVKVVKSLSIDIGIPQNADEVIKKALSYQDCGIDALLLDSKTPARPAGTGIPLSWEVAGRVREALSIPLILAGGLSPSNVSEAIKYVRPYGVDVISGVEGSPGSKDPDKVRAFVKACRGDL